MATVELAVGWATAMAVADWGTATEEAAAGTVVVVATGPLEAVAARWIGIGEARPEAAHLYFECRTSCRARTHECLPRETPA